MLRTTCFGCMSLRVRTWTSLTSPSGVVTTRADRMPVSVVIMFSTRFMPTDRASPRCRGATALALKLVKDSTSRVPSGCHLIPTGGLRTIQRPIGRHQHVLIRLVGPPVVLGDTNARCYEPFRIAHLFACFLDRGPDLLADDARALFPGADQNDHKLVAAVPPRQVSQADVGAALP